MFRKHIYIYIYGIYKECIRNIHKHLRYELIRNTVSMGRPPKAAPVFLIILYHKYLWIFLIHSLYIPYIYIYIYIYFLDMFHVFSAFVHILSAFAPCSTCCLHFDSIFFTYWKLRQVYMLKNTPHDSLFNTHIQSTDGGPSQG